MPFRLNLTIIIVTLLIALSTSSFSQTTSEFRGVGRTGIYDGTNLLKQWPDSGPEKVWSVDKLGKGFTSPATGEKLLYVSGRFDSLDYLSAVRYSGEIAWQVPYGRARDKSYPDTRSVPTINEGKVYLISGKGEVVCHDGETGRQIWKRNAFEEFHGISGPHGIAESPLIIGNKVFYTPGGFETSMVAFDKDDGSLIWQTKEIPDSTAYVSPLYINHNGQDMIIQLMANTLIGVNPEDGEILWSYNYLGLRSPEENPKVKWTNCNTPLYHKGEIFVTKGYDHPAAMFKLNDSGTAIQLKWINDLLDTHHGGNVLIDGYIYGSSWINNSKGNWACIEWETGSNQWEAEMNTKGSVIAAGDMLYFYDERRGKLALLNANPEQFDLVSSTTIEEGDGAHWAHPVIHKGMLYVRHGEVLMQFDIREH